MNLRVFLLGLLLPIPIVHADNPIALVYRGPIVGCAGCSEAIANGLKRAGANFEVKFVGPGEKQKLTSAILQTAIIYAQPGGDGDVGEANALVEKQLGARHVLSDWVKAGGRYFGTCMGGFLATKPDKPYPQFSANRWPGFGLLPGVVGRWIESAGASVSHEKDAPVEIIWKENSRRWVFFQDGPHFIFNDLSNVKILARYASNLLPAVALAELGKGKVAVSGPHLEANQDWFTSAKIKDPGDPTGMKGHALDLADELIAALVN